MSEPVHASPKGSMTISKAHLDELLEGIERPEDRSVTREAGHRADGAPRLRGGKEAPPGQCNRRNGALTKGAEGAGRRIAAGAAPRP